MVALTTRLILFIPLFISLLWKLRCSLQQRTSRCIAFFHPYCNSGGGGERVLWVMIHALLQKEVLDKVSIVIYTGDKLSKDEILLNVKKYFMIDLTGDKARSRIQFVYISSRTLLEAKWYPVATMILQSLGSVLVGFECLLRFPLRRGDVFCDTTGWAFTYPLVKVMSGGSVEVSRALGLLSQLLGFKGKSSARVSSDGQSESGIPRQEKGCRVLSYVHYPTISTDMLSKVREMRPSHNHSALLASSSLGSSLKLLYYQAFASLYSWVGGHADASMVNSSWTLSHISGLWGLEEDSESRSSALYERIERVRERLRSLKAQEGEKGKETAAGEREGQELEGVGVVQVGEKRSDPQSRERLNTLNKQFERRTSLLSTSPSFSESQLDVPALSTLLPVPRYSPDGRRLVCVFPPCNTLSLLSLPLHGPAPSLLNDIPSTRQGEENEEGRSKGRRVRVEKGRWAGLGVVWETESEVREMGLEDVKCELTRLMSVDVEQREEGVGSDGEYVHVRVSEEPSRRTAQNNSLATALDPSLSCGGWWGRERAILSVGQFRPEKDHSLQIRVFRELRQNPKYSDVRLILLGSTRSSQDETLLRSLQTQAQKEGLEYCEVRPSSPNYSPSTLPSPLPPLIFLVNSPFSCLLACLSRCSVGIHSMWNEHFGISLVEMMAAGMLVVGHNSGGPKMDIVREVQGQPSGFLASSLSEYVSALSRALDESEEEDRVWRREEQEKLWTKALKEMEKMEVDEGEESEEGDQNEGGKRGRERSVYKNKNKGRRTKTAQSKEKSKGKREKNRGEESVQIREGGEALGWRARARLASSRFSDEAFGESVCRETALVLASDK